MQSFLPQKHFIAKNELSRSGFIKIYNGVSDLLPQIFSKIIG